MDKCMTGKATFVKKVTMKEVCFLQGCHREITKKEELHFLSNLTVKYRYRQGVLRTPPYCQKLSPRISTVQQKIGIPGFYHLLLVFL